MIVIEACLFSLITNENSCITLVILVKVLKLQVWSLVAEGESAVTESPLGWSIGHIFIGH